MQTFLNRKFGGTGNSACALIELLVVIAVIAILHYPINLETVSTL
jgi:Tfp pilus assembly protein FimT